MTTTTVPADLTWTLIADAGIDTDRTERFADQSNGGHVWVTASPDDSTKVHFGVQPDPEHICDEGEHTGWAFTVYAMDPVDGFIYNEQATCFEPQELPAFLAAVKAAVEA